MTKFPHLGDLKWSLEILRRVQTPPSPYEADADHLYTRVFVTRSKAETKSGTSEFNRVVIGDQQVSHVFWIRYTTIPIDVRDRLRDAKGTLYQILSLENVDQRNQWYKIYAAPLGSDQKQSVT